MAVTKKDRPGLTLWTLTIVLDLGQPKCCLFGPFKNSPPGCAADFETRTSKRCGVTWLLCNTGYHVSIEFPMDASRKSVWLPVRLPCFRLGRFYLDERAFSTTSATCFPSRFDPSGV